MAYSDYGGYAYRDGKRIEERSDATITPEGDTFGTPGCYPGFALAASGMPFEEVRKTIEWPSGHVVLGDGPIYVVLYKQTTLHIYRGPERLEEMELMDSQPEGSIDTWTDKEGKEHCWIKTDFFKEAGTPCLFKIDGINITVYWLEEDNHYQYVQMEQPNGIIWTGWSGYGVGAGLEDADYGFSTSDREEKCRELFPMPQ